MTEAIIRPARVKDAGDIAAIYTPIVEGTAVSFEVEPPTDEEMQRRIAGAGERFPWLVCESGGSILGYAYACPHRVRPAYRWSVEVSVYVRADSRRRGIARGLYTSLIKILELQGYRNAYAGITLPNPPSVALHELMGFKPVGVYHEIGYKLGAWHDVGWWHLALGERKLPPDEPLNMVNAREDSRFEEALAAGLAHLHS
jgi:phosphinothricin acetyltransferase